MRVQVGDLQPSERLRPQQQAGDTYVRPEQAPIDKDLERLSSALGAFSTSIVGLARSQVREENKGEDPREAEVRRLVLSMGDGNFSKALAEGRVPYQDVPHVQAFSHAVAGDYAARQVINPVRLGVEQGTISLVDDNGQPRNIRDIVRERAAAALEQQSLKGSVHFTKAFYGAYDKAGDSLETAARTQQAKLNNETLGNLAATAMDSYLQGVARDQDPAKAASGLMETYGNIRKIFGQGYPNSAIENVLMGRLRLAADRDPDTVVKVLTMDRGKGPDGQPLGRLMDNGRLSTEAQEILLKATEQQSKNFDKTQQLGAAGAALDALKRGDGSFHQLQDITYENPYARPLDRLKKISASEARDLALARYEQETAQTVQGQRLPPQQAAEAVFEKAATAYIGNNVVNPRWNAAINDIGRVLGNEVDASSPANREKLMAAADLYRKIEDRNPGYAAETMKVGKREQEFFTMARFYEEDMGMPKDLAVQRAAVHVSRPKVPLTPDAKESLDRASTRVTSDIFSWFGRNSATSGTFGDANSPFSASPANVMDIQRRVRSLAETIASDQGIPADKAVDAAVKIVQRNSVLINGQAFHGDPHVTKETRPAVERLLTGIQNDPTRVVSNSMGERYTGPLSLQPAPGRKGIYHVVSPTGDPLAETRTFPADPSFVDPFTGQRGVRTERQLLRVTAEDLRNEGLRLRNSEIEAVQQRQLQASTAREQAIMRTPGVNPAVRAQAEETLNKVGVPVPESLEQRRKRQAREAAAARDAEKKSLEDYLQTYDPIRGSRN